ncbi:MAG: MBL fold metallo-hydrolase [Acidimicrobiia bacterium]|nr:MBL fold metallo-hydrolase [Acidimicrobiia bacterium]
MPLRADGGSGTASTERPAPSSTTTSAAVEDDQGPDGVADDPPAPGDDAALLEGELTVYFLDVGQGDATLLRAPDATVLIDAGRHDRSDVVDHLEDLGVTHIDVVVGTHPHADHIGQVADVLSTFEVNEVWMSGTPHTTQTFERTLDAIEDTGVAYEEPRAGDRTDVGSLSVTVLHPTVLTGNLHADSLVLRIDYGDVSFLFTGDAEGPTEADLVVSSAADLDVDVYQVGHHGSATSTTSAFLRAMSPSVAVYSAGAGNSYGHPHDVVVERLLDADVALYGTDVHGTVTVRTDGVTWSVTTERDRTD